MALSLNLVKGSVTKLPNLVVWSFLMLICMSLEMRLVQPRANKVLLNVSTSASSMRKFLDRRLIIVELSLIVSIAAPNCSQGARK